MGMPGPAEPRLATAAPPLVTLTGTAAVAVAAWRSALAISTAITMAGVSISTMATVIVPLGCRPCDSSTCIAVTKVTALTEPYDAATAAASKPDSLCLSSW